jgi:transcriptional regulator with XRE-family HTH domain
MGDYKNQIRRFRERNGLSQRKLAAEVGTSQQQIQRYETGSPVKFHMAIALAKSLNTTLAKLFPQSRSVVQKISSERENREVLLDPEVDRGLLQAGIEVDPCEWTARVIVRGGDTQHPLLYPIHVWDKNRIRHYLDWGYQESVEAKQSDEDARFFVFDAGDRTVAVNMDHLIFWQNCWDSPNMMPPTTTVRIDNEEDEEGDQEEFSYAVSVYIAGTKEPIKFDVDPDEEQPEDSEDDEGEFRDLIYPRQ